MGKMVSDVGKLHVSLFFKVMSKDKINNENDGLYLIITSVQTANKNSLWHLPDQETKENKGRVACKFCHLPWELGEMRN